jgi:hypothetical protein
MPGKPGIPGTLVLSLLKLAWIAACAPMAYGLWL